MVYRKSTYRTYKQKIYDEINKIYHQTEGRLGHRSMRVFLARKDIICSKTTVHLKQDIKIEILG